MASSTWRWLIHTPAAAAAAAKSHQSCPTPWDPTDSSPSGCSVPGILQARILEWVAMPFSRGSSRPRDLTQVSCTAGGFFTVWATREAHIYTHGCVCVCVCVCVYTQWNITQPNKEWNNAICSSMDEPRDYHHKWSQTKANIIWYHLYVECKKMI